MLQFISVASGSWILILGIVFGLALVFSYLTLKNFESFLLFLVIFTTIACLYNLLPLWVLIAQLIGLIAIVYLHIGGN